MGMRAFVISAIAGILILGLLGSAQQAFAVDSDGDGIPDGDDPCPNDPDNTCVSCNPNDDDMITPDELLAYFEAFGINENDLPFTIEGTILLIETSAGGNQNGVIDTAEELDFLNNSLENIGIPICNTVFELPDSDGDGVEDNIDNCPFVVNADQTDSDDNGIGDVCEDNILNVILEQIRNILAQILGLDNRISDLENEVAELKLIIENLQSHPWPEENSGNGKGVPASGKP